MHYLSWFLCVIIGKSFNSLWIVPQTGYNHLGPRVHLKGTHNTITMKLIAATVLGAATVALAQKGAEGRAAGVNPTGPYKANTAYWVEPGLAKNTIFAPKDVPGLKLPVSLQ
jgi:hypothetical protein